jgi:hypothetical protein
MMGKRQGLQLWITVRRYQRQPLYPCKARVVHVSRPEPPRSVPGRNQKVHRWQLLLLLGIAGGALLWKYGHAEHVASLRWMMGYKSADGVGCCSERDCFPWPIAVLQLTGEQATVRIGDTVLQLPAKSVHATQDGETYWCCRTTTDGRCPTEPTQATTRCVFYATGT